MEVLGIDVGGTGIKGAIVDTSRGELVADRYRLLTPKPARPKAMIKTIAGIVKHFDWEGPVGCGFPSVVQQGVVRTAANVSKRWIGVNARKAVEESTHCPVTILNDADAAGLAEMRFGAGRDQDGVVLIVTLGTGIGTALFVDGHLVPNLELGHVEVRGREAEEWAAEIARKREGLSWKKWAGRVEVYLNVMQQLLWPDLIIIGGGASKNQKKFFPLLSVETRVVSAEMLNEAGIVGAALAVSSAVES